MIKYERILLKLSGEALMGNSNYGIDSKLLSSYCNEVKQIVDLGCQVGIVIGGGNIFRGFKGIEKGFERVKGDYMGMLATVINGLALQSGFENIEMKTKMLNGYFEVCPHCKKVMAQQMDSRGERWTCIMGCGYSFLISPKKEVEIQIIGSKKRKG